MNDAPAAPTPPRFGRSELGAALGVAALVTFPWVLSPGDVLGHPRGEADNHLWMLWRALRRVIGDERALENLPDGLPIPLMDPIHLPVALIGWPLGLPFAYNLTLVVDLLLAFVGAWALARQLGAGRAGALAAGVIAESAPFLGGVISFGITESLPIGWIGLHAAATLRFAEQGRPRDLAFAGLTLGAFGLAGWYHVAFAVPVELALWSWALLRAQIPRPKIVLAALAQGVIALALWAWPLMEFLEIREFWSSRWHPPSPWPSATREMWRHTPTYGTDLLNLFLPAWERVPISKSVYVGLVSLGLALAAGRRAWGLWAVVLPLWALAMGHWLSIGGDTSWLGRVWRMPAGALTQHIPALEGLSHWHRAAGPAVIFFAVAAGMGAERLLTRWPRALPWLLGAALLDNLALSQTPFPRDLYDATPPAAWAWIRAQGGEGGVVVLPFDNGRREFSEEVPRLYNRWQPGLNLPISESYEGPDALLSQSRLIAVADRLCGVTPTTPAAWRPPKAMQRVEPLAAPEAMEAEVRALRAQHLDWIALHRDRARSPDEAARLLTRALGAPTFESGDVVVWKIP